MLVTAGVTFSPFRIKFFLKENNEFRVKIVKNG